MNKKQIARLLHDFKSGKMDEQQALVLLMQGALSAVQHDGHFPDRHRLLRQGLSEVVYAESKKTKKLVQIARERQADNAPVLFTRLRKNRFARYVNYSRMDASIKSAGLLSLTRHSSRTLTRTNPLY